MIDPELLEKLVAFQKYGTLSATADHLMVTQPTITRSMKKFFLIAVSAIGSN